MRDKSATSNDIKGVKIQTLLKIFSAIGVVLIVFLIVNLHTVVSDYSKLTKEFDLHMHSHEWIGDLQDASDEMTEQCRLFVVTEDPECMQKYFDVVDSRVRENAHDNVDKYFDGKDYAQSLASLDVALKASNSLMDDEMHSMKLMCQALGVKKNKIPEAIRKYELPEGEELLSNETKIQIARELVFDTKYRKDKERIDKAITMAVDEMSTELEADMHIGMDNVGRMISEMALICLLIALLLVLVIILLRMFVIHPVQIYTKCIRENRKLDMVGPRELKYLANTYNNIFDINQATKLRTEYMLEHDALTDACSRLAFEEQKKALATSEAPIALLIFDVDRFKEINDVYGHDAGDHALKTVVKAIRSTFRGEDIVARIGGDEFAVVLMNMTSQGSDIIEAKLDKLNYILQNPEDDVPAVSVSIGIAFSECGFNEELFQQADSALYEAKAHGKSRYWVYED